MLYGSGVRTRERVRPLQRLPRLKQITQLGERCHVPKKMVVLAGGRRGRIVSLLTPRKVGLRFGKTLTSNISSSFGLCTSMNDISGMAKKPLQPTVV
jgi:hypothetical protein